MGAVVTRKNLEDAVKLAIARACSAPMQWGKDDCGLWVADAVRDVLGYDPVADLRGRYSDRDGAIAVMGYGGLAGTFRRIAKRHGWRVIRPQRAQPGDVGLVDTVYDGERTLGSVICRAPGWFVGRNEHGVTVVRSERVRVCWKIAPHVRKKNDVMETKSVSMPAMHHRSMLIPTSQAAHEPISLAIGLTALLESTALFPILGITAAQFGGTLVAVGLSIGLNYAASALQQRGNQPLQQTSALAPNDPAIRYNTRQAIPPKRIIYGTAQVGGALFFESTINPFLYQGLMLCAKPIRGISKIWIGANELSFSALTPDTILTPLAVSGQPDYAGNLQVSLRLGNLEQEVDQILERDFGSLAGSPISGATGSNIGNMTQAGGLAAAFDGNRSQASTACAKKDGTPASPVHVGKDYGAGTERAVVRARATGSSDRQFYDYIDTAEFNIKIQASTDNFSSSIVTFIDETTTDIQQFDRGFANTTAYRYWRLLLTPITNVDRNFYVAELEFFEDSGVGFRQQGIATAVLRYDFGADQTEYTNLWGQTQRPNPIFLVDGISVPDPRKTGHILEYDPNDADAVEEAEASWEWSDNAALCQAHFLTQRWGGRIDPRKINWDKVADAADWDDGMVGTLEGDFIKRGTINGLITLNQNPSTVLSSMLSANRGFVLESAGRVWVSSSTPKSPVLTIHDAIISGAIEYRAAKPKKDMLNKLKARFVAEDREYQTVDGPVLSRTDLQTSDQEILEGVLDLPFTLDNRRAQVLQKAFLQTSRLGRRLNCTVDIEALANAADELVGNSVTFDSVLWPNFNGTYFVESWGFTDNFGSIQLALSEYDPTIETDWNPNTDQQPFELADLEV